MLNEFLKNGFKWSTEIHVFIVGVGDLVTKTKTSLRYFPFL